MGPDESGERRGGASLPMARSFVVQFTADAVADPQRFHGRVEHIETGRSRRFVSLDELLAFVNELLACSDSREQN